MGYLHVNYILGRVVWGIFMYTEYQEEQCGVFSCALYIRKGSVGYLHVHCILGMAVWGIFKCDVY